MEKKLLGIIEIGSNNTKTHIYRNDEVIYDNTTTIEFKKNYNQQNRILDTDFEKLKIVIQKTLEYTENVHIYGCSIFRKLTQQELKEINEKLNQEFGLEIEVVSQEEEANLTALGCYSNIQYDGNICIFIGGGGSVELIFVNNRKVVNKKFYSFGVVDITKKYPSLKNDVPECTFDEVSSYLDGLIGNLDIRADVLILAGGDHFYWYNNAQYALIKNTVYEHEKQPYMITAEMNDKYDRNAYVTSLDKIRQHSDNPIWFDGSRAMKAITNMIAHKVNAKYIIPTKINMEDGLKNKLQNAI